MEFRRLGVEEAGVVTDGAWYNGCEVFWTYLRENSCVCAEGRGRIALDI